jgi:serine phosphatase RsbU (regulator of sigma subunit)
VRYEPALGYKKNSTVNELNLMGRGDILLLYTDGLLDPFSEFNRRHLERVVSSMRAAPAREICSGVIGRRLESAGQSDDLSLVVIKRE